MIFQPSLPPVLLAISFAAALSSIDRVHGTEPAISKLHGRHAETPFSYSAGQSVALSDRYVLVGEPDNSDDIANRGAVHVYNAANGRYLRKLVPTDGDEDDGFGWSVAVSGTTAIVGAPYAGPDETGKVYVFDLRNGRQKLAILPADGVTGDRFGWAVCAESDRGLVGAPMNDQGNQNSGAAYLFDLNTGDQLRKFYQETRSLGIELGTSVALCGRMALAGAPKFSGDDFDREGAALLYDTKTGSWIGEYVSPDPSDDLAFGSSVSMSTGYALIGAPGDDEGGAGAGAAYLVDLRKAGAIKILRPEAESGDAFGSSVSLSGNLALIGADYVDANGPDEGYAGLFLIAQSEETGMAPVEPLTDLAVTPLIELERGDADAYDYFGRSVALCGNRAVVGAPGDDDLDAESGAAYLYRDLVGPLPGWTHTQKGNSAPEVIDAEFRRFVQPFYTDESANLLASLSGPGSNRNRDTGVWKFFDSSWSVLAIKHRNLFSVGNSTELDGLTCGSFSVVGTGQDGALFDTVLSGTGVTGRNNHALILDDRYDSPDLLLLRTGTPVPELNDSEVLRTLGPRAEDTVAIPYLLRRGTGDANATNDSGALTLNPNDASVEDATLREGGGGLFGEWRQFFGRASVGQYRFVTGANFIPAGESKALPGLVIDPADGPLVRQGDAEYGAGGATFRSFLGEGLNLGDDLIFRSTLVGGDARASNNEGLFFNNDSGTTARFFREGDEIDPVDQPGVVISRFLKWWSGERPYALVKLRGPGVRASNDCALIVSWNQFAPFDRIEVLLREGDVMDKCDGARVRAILRAEVDAHGSYTVLVSLTGSPATNQALLVGDCNDALDYGQPAFATPVMLYRKGRLFQASGGGTTKLRSMTLATQNDRFGVGGQGLPKVVSGGGFLSILTFTDRAQEFVETPFFQPINLLGAGAQ
ncbi:MAG: FG-GAP repeat protein [Verrucomicrobiae bacterium]|nr:FG-GAP repeat protein [Verrucomicrobiae bacterium]